MNHSTLVPCILVLSSLAYGCDGTDGTDGMDGTNGRDGTEGLNAAFRSTAEPAGANCADVGTKLEFGLDDNRNGTLDDAEVDGTSFVCGAADGSAGLSSQIAIGDIAVGTNECPNGGVQIEYGLDDDDDGTLDAAEIDNSQLLCVPTRRRLVFTTAAAFDGDLGGLSGAILKCQDAANAVPTLAGRTFVPWLSTTNNSPAADFARDGEFVQVNGAVVANSWADLTDGTTNVPLNVTETGGRPSARYAFTGTATDGTLTASSNCADWTSNGGLEFRFGHVDVAAAALWTLDPGNGNNCIQQYHLYCFER